MTERFNIPRSTVIAGIEWLGERIPYPEAGIKGDTFPMTWADDGEIYTSAGDPNWGQSHWGLDVEKFSGGPSDYKISKVQEMPDYTGWGGNGPKPSGMICVDGTLYLAYQNLLRIKPPAWGLASQNGTDAQIVYSSDHGFLFRPQISDTPAPMFPGHKFGGPAFINYGRNNANARDNYIYAVSSDQWDNGSNLRLGRVPKEGIMRRESWEWVAAWTPGGEPVWSPALEEAIPVLSCHRYIGLPDMVYLAGIRHYLLLTWRLHGDFSPDAGTDLLILEAPEPWGPFSLVYFEEYWEGKEFNPYCPRLPLKWIAGDGLTGWLQFSGRWDKLGQEKLYYRSNVRPFKLLLR
jgi:hypothetical protein